MDPTKTEGTTAATPAAETVPDHIDLGDASIAAFEASLSGTPAPEVTDPPTIPETPTGEPPKPADKPAEPTPAEVEAKAAQKAARKILFEAKKAEKRAKATAAVSGEELIALAKSKPVEFLKRTGQTVEQFLESVANDGETPAAPTTTEAKLAALEAKVAAFEKATKDANEKADADRKTAESAANDKRAVDAVVAQVKAAEDKFPHIKRGEAHSLVVDTMISFYNKNGKTCSVEDAAKATEAYLAKLAGTAAATPTTTALAQARPGTETLTNEGARGRTPVAGEDPYSVDDMDLRIKQVAAAVEAATTQRGN